MAKSRIVCSMRKRGSTKSGRRRSRLCSASQSSPARTSPPTSSTGPQTGSIDEEPHGLELRERRQSGQGLEVGQRERRNRKFLLPRDAQRNTAADQHPQPRTSLEELRRDCCGFEHLLEVVEHEQRLFFP